MSAAPCYDACPAWGHLLVVAALLETAWKGASIADAPPACYQNSVASPLPENFVAACEEIVRAYRTNAFAADVGTGHSSVADDAAEASQATVVPVPSAAGAWEERSHHRGAVADSPSDHWGTSSSKHQEKIQFKLDSCQQNDT